MTDRKGHPKADPKAVRRALIVLGIVILVGVGLRLRQASVTEEVETALIVINSGTITAEIADTSAKKELGLGERDELLPRHGMYFQFPIAQKWLFWMKGMRFPIDAIWIRDGIVVDVTRGAQPPEGGPIERFSPSEKADAVLEVNMGEADELNVKKGDRVLIKN